nr:TMV resistance protein N-like [Ipomoea batatas]
MCDRSNFQPGFQNDDLSDQIRDLATDCVCFPEIDFANSRSERSGDLQSDGRPIIKFSEAEWIELEEIEGNCTLVGRFVRERPSLDTIRAKISSVLRLDGIVQIGFLSRHSIMLRFELESDFKKARIQGQITIDGAKAWFTRWTADWCESRDSPLALVWIELPNLPLHLFNFESITRICAPIGRAIDLDSATCRRSRPSVAKVRLEIDVSKPMIDKIRIEIVNGYGGNGGAKGLWQRIVYGRMPRFCIECGRFGHVRLNCWSLRAGGGRPMRGGGVAVPVVTPEGKQNEGVAVVPAAVGSVACEAEVCLQREIEIFSPVGEMEQSAPMVSKISGKELIESGSSGRSKGRMRRKKRGFRVGNALQILALDYGDEERLDGLEKWIDDLKEKVGHDEELIRAVDEAYEEVLELFEEALEDLGVPGEDIDDELVCKAALIFWKKWEKIIQTSKELREAHAVSKGNERGESSGEQWEGVGGEMEGEGACGSDKRRGKEEDAIYEECDIVGEEIGVGFREKEGEKKKYNADCDECSASSEEEANVENGDDEYDDVEKDANVEDGEYDEDEFNDDEWLDWLEGKLRYARGVNWMNEVLKEIYSYMQVVYDEQQQVHWEEEGSMALKACIILREVVRVSPMRGCLHPESELGYLLLMNQEIIGRRLCRWAWRRFRRGWEEKLMRLDVNPYGIIAPYLSLRSLLGLRRLEQCFAEVTAKSAAVLLSIGEAIAKSKRSPEKLFVLLDMYEIMTELHPQVKQSYFFYSITLILLSLMALRSDF